MPIIISLASAKLFHQTLHGFHTCSNVSAHAKPNKFSLRFCHFFLQTEILSMATTYYTPQKQVKTSTLRRKILSTFIACPVHGI